MKQWLQRVRGFVGIGVTWAAAWAPIGALVGVLLPMLLPGSPVDVVSVVARNAVTFGVLGFIGGAIFGNALRLAEGHHRFHELSLTRIAGWGAVGGCFLGSVAVAAGLWGAGFGALGVGMTGAATLLSAGSAAGSLAIARRAVDHELIQSGADLSITGPKET